jgi:hypothetical protein
VVVLQVAGAGLEPKAESKRIAPEFLPEHSRGGTRTRDPGIMSAVL